ncbi:hypothetical protein CARUB_v10006228mg [Capsella rubella]|uniref:RING-type E3 ubiquitin transferase n=1 Tax=Capsella rubella TaxID=81985 RepID=R0F7F6_9BRAS|nr:hypothetical protein CARUB_v10006228mg [Capsella rubella]
MLNFDVLDCPICCEPLTIPIFQCDNGHLACSSCFPKLSNKCPSCHLLVGHKRCIAMESVLESVYVPCPNAKFGCNLKIPYGKEPTHERECTFSQCLCPVEYCNYTCSYRNLYAHHCFYTHHGSYSSNGFTCGNFVSVQMNIMQCFKEPCGVYVTVSCIAPPNPEVGRFSYHLSYTVDGQTMT